MREAMPELPAAMAEPTPVSASLQSATMVKAGLFMMMRLYPILGGTALFEGVVGRQAERCLRGAARGALAADLTGLPIGFGRDALPVAARATRYAITANCAPLSTCR